MKYPKINTVWKRDESNKHKIIVGDISCPEFDNIKRWHVSEKIHGVNTRIEFSVTTNEGLISITNINFFGKTDDAQIIASLVNYLKQTFTDLTLSKIIKIKTDKETGKYINEQYDATLIGEGYGCFAWNTQVLLDDGTKKLISVIVNQKIKAKVLTYNFKKNIIESSDILNYFKYPPKKLLKIELEKIHKGGRGKNGQIICTDNHLICTDNGYKQAKDLTTNDVVMSLQQGLSYIQKQVVLGTLLGDGSKFGEYGINIAHSKKQIEYINLLKKIFANVHISESYKTSGYGSEIISLIMYNKGLFRDIIDVCYQNGKKRLNKEWLDKLTPLSLAIWYMDDGSIDNIHRRNQRAAIATQSINIDELKLLQDILYLKYGIKGNLRKLKNKQQYSLRFSTEESHMFFMLISPFIIKSLKYKLPKCYKDMPCVFEHTENFLQESKSLMKAKIKNISIDTQEDHIKSSTYDIQTKNENYFVGSGFLVHNSKVQKGGGRYRDDASFILFDANIAEWWLEPHNVKDIANTLGISYVPEIGIMDMDQIVALVKTGFKSKISKDTTLDAEGVVARSYPMVLFRDGTPLMFKLKTNDYKKLSDGEK